VPSQRDLHDSQVAFRVRKRELTAWKRAAKRADEPFSLWARKMLNLASAPPVTPRPPTASPTVAGDQIELPFTKKRRAS